MMLPLVVAKVRRAKVLYIVFRFTEEDIPLLADTRVFFVLSSANSPNQTQDIQVTMIYKTEKRKSSP